ncbi:hypothetical protein N7510_010676 [Penicillium lagena]|uniref:uncharacterized protein n=1 Tax=Penicillium lagena TaxID=94218 RepID=UPI002542098B|nr:uncharacterized protein N7510_010676 [Penicillium lagena]KAJ5601142.1 hypothetical protein N7510_010676 [Penicillium lagena]
MLLHQKEAEKGRDLFFIDGALFFHLLLLSQRCPPSSSPPPPHHPPPPPRMAPPATFLSHRFFCAPREGSTFGVINRGPSLALTRTSKTHPPTLSLVLPGFLTRVGYMTTWAPPSLLSVFPSCRFCMVNLVPPRGWEPRPDETLFQPASRLAK